MIYLLKLSSRISTLSFKNRINEFIYLMILSSMLTGIMYILNFNISSILIFSLIVSSILSATTLRMSNCLVYSLLTGDLGMSIKDTHPFHSLDYKNDKCKISQIFKDDCIKGLIELSGKPYGRKIKATTHKWVYEKVLCNEEILKLYEVKAKKCGQFRIPKEVLSLVSDDSFNKYKDYISKSVLIKRDKYKVILIRKEK